MSPKIFSTFRCLANSASVLVRSQWDLSLVILKQMQRTYSLCTCRLWLTLQHHLATIVANAVPNVSADCGLVALMISLCLSSLAFASIVANKVFEANASLERGRDRGRKKT